MIELFSANTPNGKKISIMLEEIGYDYKVTKIDIDNREQFKPEFKKISPLSKIPIIIDHKKNQTIFESGAILIYLAEESGKFYDKKNRIRINQWLMVQMSYVGPMLGQHHQFHHYNPGKSKFGEERYFKITKKIYQDLNNRLENLNKVNSKQIIIFKQLLFYYKFDLHHNAMTWYGSKGCLKKDLLTFNWLRNIKNKTYNFWRIDTFFSKNKYMNVKIIENGGWHFTNIKSPEDIHMKLSNYGEHNEFEMSGIDLAKMSKLVKEKKVYFNHNLDKSNPNKYSYGHELVKINKNLLPKFLVDNYLKFNDWFEYKL